MLTEHQGTVFTFSRISLLQAGNAQLSLANRRVAQMHLQKRLQNYPKNLIILQENFPALLPCLTARVRRVFLFFQLKEILQHLFGDVCSYLGHLSRKKSLPLPRHRELIMAINAKQSSWVFPHGDSTLWCSPTGARAPGMSKPTKPSQRCSCAELYCSLRQGLAKALLVPSAPGFDLVSWCHKIWYRAFCSLSLTGLVQCPAAKSALERLSFWDNSN